jgi:hypothetical protein
MPALPALKCPPYASHTILASDARGQEMSPSDIDSGQSGLPMKTQKEQLNGEQPKPASAQAPSQPISELQKLMADAKAQKELSDAQTLSAVSRLIGEVKVGSYTGSVDMKPSAGNEEALLLGARAVKEAATKVAKAVNTISGGPTIIYIFAAKEFPNFHHLLTYRVRKELIKQAFAVAEVVKPKPARPDSEAVATPALISAGVDAFSKILGFFKTDYTLSGSDVKLDESMLLYSVAGELKDKEVHLPLVYAPVAQTDAITRLSAELLELVELRGCAVKKHEEINEKVAALEKSAAGAVNPSNEEITRLKQKADQLSGVIALYDAFASALTTPDTNGMVPVSVLVQEYTLDIALKANAGVLLLRLENTGGGYLLKKNLLTGLGAMPLYHMGGATVTYLLLAGPNSKVLAGDVVAIHGGFVRTDQLREELQK